MVEKEYPMDAGRLLFLPLRDATEVGDRPLHSVRGSSLRGAMSLDLVCDLCTLHEPTLPLILINMLNNKKIQANNLGSNIKFRGESCSPSPCP